MDSDNVLVPSSFALVQEGDPGHTFKLDILLDKGSSGQVWRGRNELTGDEVAIKIIEKSHGGFTQLALETQFLALCTNDFITKYHGCWITDTAIWIVMELADLGSMETVMQVYMYHAKFSEDELSFLCACVLYGLHYLHSVNLIHRDIKGKNILITRNGEVKLADLGIAARLQNKGALETQKIGSPHWMAPEMLTGGGYNTKVDIWALGITLIEWAEGAPPYDEVAPFEVLKIIPDAPPPKFKNHKDWSSKMIDFLKVCLDKNFESRPSAAELLNHPFVVQQKQHVERRDFSILQNVSRRIYDVIEDWRTDDFEKSLNPKSDHFDKKVRRVYDLNQAKYEIRDQNRERYRESHQEEFIEREKDEIASWGPPGVRSVIQSWDSSEPGGKGGANQYDTFNSLNSVEETASQKERVRQQKERELREAERERLEREKERERKLKDEARLQDLTNEKQKKGMQLLERLNLMQTKASAKDMAQYMDNKK